jgi:hypothetical protein
MEGLRSEMIDALAAADEKTARATKFVLGLLRDRFSLRTQFTQLFRRLDADKSGRIEKHELGAYLDNLNVPLEDGVLELVMMQLDPQGPRSQPRSQPRSESCSRPRSCQRSRSRRLSRPRLRWLSA